MFYKYLVDKKILSPEQVVKAVVRQLESMPSLLRVIQEEGLLGHDKIYELILISLQKQMGLYEAIKSYGGLDDQVLARALKKQNDKSLSFGEILIDLGFVDKEKFDELLRSYSPSDSEPVQIKEPSLNEVKTEPSPEKEPTSAPAGGGISAAALESLKQVQGLDESMIADLESQAGAMAQSDNDSMEMEVEEDWTSESEPEVESEEDSSESMSVMTGEYLDYYSEEVQSDLYVTANRYCKKGKERDLIHLHEELTKILSLAKLNGFHFQEKVLHLFESLVSQILNGVLEAPANFRDSLLPMLEIMWEFRKQVENHGNEEALLTKTGMKEKYLTTLKSVMGHLKRSA